MILVDANNLAYIAFYSLGELSNEEERTGTIFGFLMQVNRIAEQFGRQIVFCFDSRKSLRKQLIPSYKENRNKDLDEDKARELRLMHQQLTRLRKEILPRMGFKNVRIKPGYEADDLIAHYCKKYGHKGSPRSITIVSTDEDLYQLLSPNVRIYNPRKKSMFTMTDFKKKYGIPPEKWIEVKSIAGCTTDNIKGVYGVGEKTAIKFIKNNLAEKTKAYQMIKQSITIYGYNKKLVSLPYEGGRDIIFGYKKNVFRRIDFIEVFDELRFIHFLKEEQFTKWEKNFKLKRKQLKRRKP